MAATGSPSDYGETAISGLRSRIAGRANVAVEKVDMTINAASVLITAVITLPSTVAHNLVLQTLWDSFYSASQASAVLGVTVVSTPTLEAPPAPPPLAAHDGSTGLSDSATLALVVAGLLITCICVCGYLCHGASKRRLEPDRDGFSRRMPRSRNPMRV